MSKGSTPRPRQVAREEYERRWEKAFGGDDTAGKGQEQGGRDVLRASPPDVPRAEWNAHRDASIATAIDGMLDGLRRPTRWTVRETVGGHAMIVPRLDER